MILTHTQTTLLTTLLGAMNRKVTAACLGHLYFTPAGNRIVLTASDLDCDFFWPIQHPVSSLQQPVSCPIAWFLKTARTLPKDGHLEIRAEGPTVHLLPSKGPSVRSPERSLPLKNAPPFTTTGCTRGGWLSASTLQTCVKAIPFISTDETRYVLLGTLIQAGGHVVATDGRRLAHSPTPDTELPQDIILPTRFITALAAITARNNTRTPVWLNGSGATDGFGAQDATLLLTQADGCSIRFRLIDGHYPNWRQVVPQDFTTLVTFREGLLADLTALMRSASGKGDPTVQITLAAGRKVTAELRSNGEPVGDALDAGTHASRELYTTAYNAAFFRDVLNFSGPTLRLIDASSPAVGGIPTGAQTVLMPMRVNVAA